MAEIHSYRQEKAKDDTGEVATPESLRYHTKDSGFYPFEPRQREPLRL